VNKRKSQEEILKVENHKEEDSLHIKSVKVVKNIKKVVIRKTVFIMKRQRNMLVVIEIRVVIDKKKAENHGLVVVIEDISHIEEEIKKDLADKSNMRRNMKSKLRLEIRRRKSEEEI